jgi:hypothetical protein
MHWYRQQIKWDYEEKFTLSRIATEHKIKLTDETKVKKKKVIPVTGRGGL